MPIINYSAKAEEAEKEFFANPAISDKNKQAVKRYLQQYVGKSATRLKFFNHIRFLLAQVDDLEKAMRDRDLINGVFDKFRKSLSPGYLGTLINVSKALTRWLNDGEVPFGFKDIKSVSKKDQKRKLDAQDMWTWDDGENCAAHTTSQQFKAIILTQLDAGFRPSEFIDLNYGDVVVKKDTVIFQVKAGKTGARDVPCYRSAPFFLRWYHQHPTKKKTDPLWVMEHLEKSHPQEKRKNDFSIRRYDYYALQKRLRQTALKSKIKKPADFYNLRHSSCTMDKIDNVPLDLAAKRHGHSVKHFDEIYGRLDLDDIANRMRKHYTGEDIKKKMIKNITCARCDHSNAPASNVCFKCNYPLTVKMAIALSEAETKNVSESIEKELLAKMPSLLKKLIDGKYLEKSVDELEKERVRLKEKK